MKKILFAVIAMLVLIGAAQAQITGTTNIAVNVQVTQQSTISLGVSGGPLVFTPNGSGVPTSNNVTFSTQFNLAGANHIYLYTFFSNPAAALSTSQGANIPASALQANWVNNSGFGASGSTSKACSQSYGVGNGTIDGAQCERVDFIEGSAWGGPIFGSTTTPNLTVTYGLSIPGYVAAGYAAGNYSGTLNAVIIAS